MPKHRVLICEFPGGGITHPDVAGWVGDTRLRMDRDERIGPGNHARWHKNDTPITLSRNVALAFAERERFDHVLMIDNDLSPDLPFPDAKPFWESAWEFALQHEGPCVIAAPYCGPPPYEMPFVFHWTNQQTDDPNPNFQLSAYSRAHAATMKGIQRAAALPTGLMLIDMRAIHKMPHPRFYYEWKDDGPACEHCGVKKPGPQIEKGSTEDVTFSRDLDALGVPLYCAWDSWSGHWKPKRVEKPQSLASDAVPHQIRERAAQIFADQAVKTAASDGEVGSTANRIKHALEKVQ